MFGSGTLQWPWGLEANHDSESGVPPERQNGSDTRVGVDPNGPDRNIQQATLNLFADMGVQPTTVQSDLIPATASTDDIPPSSAIDGELLGSAGTEMKIVGAASDLGGGVVAAVEVSVDGGASWHPAVGRTRWSYVWMPRVAGAVTVLSRAVDDSGNLEAVGAGTSLTIEP